MSEGVTFDFGLSAKHRQNRDVKKNKKISGFLPASAGFLVSCQAMLLFGDIEMSSELTCWKYLVTLTLAVNVA